MKDSKIQWTHHTANLWHGCTKVHAGCDNCYAETMSKRFGKDIWGNDKPRLAVKSVFKELAKYQKQAEQTGQMHRVFVGSMMDIFEKPMPVVNSKGEPVILDDPGSQLYTSDMRDILFLNISKNEYPNLMFLFLTKRPSNINKMIPEIWISSPPANVMFGCSPVDQKTADKLIPQLLEVNGRLFLSMEPMLGPVNLEGLTQGRIQWIITGGESGPHKRPYNTDWFRSIRDFCKTCRISFFMKQMDGVLPIPDDLIIREFPMMPVPPFNKFPMMPAPPFNLKETEAGNKILTGN